MRLALLAVLALVANAETLPPLPRSPDLYVSGFFASSIHRYYGPRNALTGAHPAPGRGSALYAQGVVRRPWGIAFGPDGNLYVANSSGATPAIVRVSGPFTATPGAFETFVEGGAVYDLAFGPDQNLYAAGHGPVLRYDVVTGAPIDEFTHGYALAETRGLAFGPDGYLYVSNYDSCVMGPNGCTGARGEVVRFDALTGAFVDVWVHSGDGGLGAPWKIVFGPSGDLFVVNWTTDHNNILRYRTGGLRLVRSHGPSSAVFIARDGWFPLSLAFGPDGNLYVSDSTSSGSGGAVLRFDGKTGAFLDTFVPEVEGGPRGIAFAPGRP